MVYQLQGNPVQIPVTYVAEGRVDNLKFDELAREVLRRHNAKFQGLNGIEDLTPYSEGQPISFSNTIKALSIDEILNELARENPEYAGIRVFTFKDAVRFFSAVPERSSTYADTSSISLFPKEGPNEELRRQVLDITGKTKDPLVVDGLTTERTGDSFALARTDRFKVTEAPYLRKDGFVKYNQETGEVEQCKEGDKGSVRLYVPNSQSGLRGLYRYWDVLYSRSDDLLNSGVTGRVQLVQEPLARAENFEALLNAQFAEMQERYTKAVEFLRTGKL